MCVNVIASTSFSEGRSFLISSRIGSGRASMQSKKVAQWRTVPRFWDKRFLTLEPMQIAFGCFYQGIWKLPFRRRLRLRPRRLRASLRLLLLSLLHKCCCCHLLQLVPLLLRISVLLLLLLLLVKSARHVLNPTRDLSNRTNSHRKRGLVSNSRALSLELVYRLDL
jgi:hypothetical protein